MRMPELNENSMVSLSLGSGRSGMIHDILCALNGNIGSFFQEYGDSVKVDEELPLTPGERVLINRLLAIAFHYKKLKHFIEANALAMQLAGIQAGGSNKSEQYKLALCNGLAEVLKPYKQCVDKLEETVLLDPYQPLSYVLGQVDPYECLLQVLVYIVEKMEAEGANLDGCRILELLHRNSLSVAANVKVAVERIQRSCHEVLFKQLAAWLFQGHLSDHEAFFIQKLHPSSGEESEVEVVQQNLVSSLYAAYSEFRLCSELLPSYIPLSLASNILYIGQTVVMLQQRPQTTQQATDSAADVENPLDVWGGRDMEFLEELQTMQNAETFQLERLTWLVDAARLCVTQHLWRLAVHDAKLVDEMKLIKDMFLLGRGELFLEFIRQADGVLSKPPSSLSLREANQALRTAARNINLEDESLFDKFQICFSPLGASGWESLALSCKVQWPLQLLFDSSAFQDYNSLFQFLLQVRRVQLDLQALWKCQIREKALVGCEANPDLWQLRRNFTFLVDNLQYYLQVDVLESQFSAFMAATSATDNFEDVQQAHSRALANIMSQSFLFSNKGEKTRVKLEEKKAAPKPQHAVMRCLLAVLELSSRFCQVARAVEGGEQVAGLPEQLQSLEEDFLRHVGLLKQLLVGLRGQPSGTALSQLLLRLDFNSWISEHCVTIDDLLA